MTSETVVMRPYLLAVATGLAMVSGPVAFAQSPLVVVELFTSQGCSSCPPADAFLTELAQQRPDILPLAFHVTYWNSLGWKDPFSLDAATIRQQDFARSLGGDEVYTPEMVVNGAVGFIGSNRNEGLAVIAKAAETSRRHVDLRLARDRQTLVVSVGEGIEHAEILLVGFDPQHHTTVGRGENGGRTLLESNIVRSLTPIGRWQGAASEFRHAIPIGEQFAALLQSDDGRVIGAAILGASPS